MISALYLILTEHTTVNSTEISGEMKGLSLKQKVDTHLQKGLSLTGNEATGLKMEGGFPV